MKDKELSLSENKRSSTTKDKNENNSSIPKHESTPSASSANGTQMCEKGSVKQQQ